MVNDQSNKGDQIFANFAIAAALAPTSIGRLELEVLRLCSRGQRLDLATIEAKDIGKIGYGNLRRENFIG
jgi:hypothetical protein